MPHRVAVKCPGCGSRATFEFAEVVRIQLKKDVAYFQSSQAFEYGYFQDSAGSRWHAAIFYHGLKRTTLNSIQDLPDGYAPEDWDHSQYLYRSHGGDFGAVVCTHCDHRSKHILHWPTDAYFQIDYKGKVLWSYDEESTAELLEYVRSKQRNRQDYKWQGFLMKIPSHFFEKGARATVSKKLEKLLMLSDEQPSKS